VSEGKRDRSTPLAGKRDLHEENHVSRGEKKNYANQMQAMAISVGETGETTNRLLEREEKRKKERSFLKNEALVREKTA